MNAMGNKPPMQMDGPCAMYIAKDRMYIGKMWSFFFDFFLKNLIVVMLVNLVWFPDLPVYSCI